jgi:hypothetical protein
VNASTTVELLVPSARSVSAAPVSTYYAISVPSGKCETRGNGCSVEVEHFESGHWVVLDHEPVVVGGPGSDTVQDLTWGPNAATVLVGDVLGPGGASISGGDSGGTAVGARRLQTSLKVVDDGRTLYNSVTVKDCGQDSIAVCVGGWGPYLLPDLQAHAGDHVTVELWELGAHNAWVEVGSAPAHVPPATTSDSVGPFMSVPPLQSVFPVPSETGTRQLAGVVTFPELGGPGKIGIGCRDTSEDGSCLTHGAEVHLLNGSGTVLATDQLDGTPDYELNNLPGGCSAPSDDCSVEVAAGSTVSDREPVVLGGDTSITVQDLQVSGLSEQLLVAGSVMAPGDFPGVDEGSRANPASIENLQSKITVSVTTSGGTVQQIYDSSEAKLCGPTMDVACTGNWGAYELPDVNNPTVAGAVPGATKAVVALWEEATADPSTWVEVDSVDVTLPTLASGYTTDAPTVTVPPLQAVYPVPSS